MVVVLFHFGVPGFDGGFVGVDVFFVISGFLMTGIIVRGLQQENFSIFNFYMARAKRIVPALLVLCASLLAFGWFYLLPSEFKTLASHSVYSLSFLSNVEFWQDAGYFDQASHEKWLLHTWSLSVEWQFYLLLPLVLAIAWRVKSSLRMIQVTMLVLFTGSFGVSIWTTATDSAAAFFLLHTRIWEMAAGGLVFLFARPPAQHSAAQRRWLEIGGLLFIVLAVVLFDAETPWPGWHALVPVGGAAMVLTAQRSSLWTGHAVAQWLGTRSYSLYLWHWPLAVALAYLELRHEWPATGVALVLTLVLSQLSYVLVENRSRSLLGRARLPIAAGLLAVAGMMVFIPGFLIWQQQGVSGRFPVEIEQVAAESENFNSRRQECHTYNGQTSNSCVYGGKAWKVLVLGDSHAGALVTSAESALGPAAGVVQWSYSGCPFVAGLKKTPLELRTQGLAYRCTDFVQRSLERLEQLPASIPVVLVNRFAASVYGENENGSGEFVPTVFFSRPAPGATPEFIAEYSAGITNTACMLAKRRTVYLVRPIPEIGKDVPKIVSRRLIRGDADDVSISLAEYFERNRWVWLAQDAARDRCGVMILDPLVYLCKDGRCHGSLNGRPLYHDDDHLSEYGNKLLKPMFSTIR